MPASTVQAFRIRLQWILVVVAFALLIGYRHEVGGDWFNYLRMLDRMQDAGLVEALTLGEPGYRLLEWFAWTTGGGIYTVNLLSGIIFAYGLAVFCRSLPRPWLALTVAVPYLVVVVSMGYTRQACAIGLAMLGLVALGHRSVRSFVLFVFLAATFHKSAVLLLPIAALAATRRRLWVGLWVGLLCVLGYYLILEESIDYFVQGYFEDAMQSEGAQIRLAMNALPAALLLLWRDRFRMALPHMQLWWWAAAISLVMLALLFATEYSTALDRMALYLLPLQIVVFSHLPGVFRERRERTLISLAIIALYAAVLLVWLNYGGHASHWLPYEFYPLVAAS
jgi:hypothetical protein